MLQNILLQAGQVVDTTQQAIATALQNQSTISIWDIILKGGYIMIPIGILFAMAIYVFIERFLTIRSATVNEGNFMFEIQNLIQSEKIDKALDVCKRSDLPIARMIEKGIRRIGRPIKEIEESIEIVGKFEVYELERGLQILAIIAGIAPMFGFLGTIFGVIKIFFDISITSDVSIGTVSSGLYTKMVSSAAGLVVGILAYVFYNWLNIKVSKAVNKMEKNAMNFIDFLQEPNK